MTQPALQRGKDRLARKQGDARCIAVIGVLGIVAGSKIAGDDHQVRR
jgi:hypothetical protein